MHPMRAGLARMVAALRAAIAVAAVGAAVTGAVRPVSWLWLGPALALVIAWTPVYVTVAWTRGLRPWLIGIDLCVAAALSLGVGHLVPAAALSGTSSWVATVTSMTVVSAQLAGAPLASVPAGLAVVAAFVAGQRLAGSADSGLTALSVMTVQTLAGAAVMAVAMRIERSAVRSFRRLQEASARAELALARREDERAQLRMVHNGPLTTLTMALHAAEGGEATATLRYRAAAALAALESSAGQAGAAGTAGAAADGGQDGRVRLDERLSQVTVWYAPRLAIAADLHPVLVPGAVAEAITGAVAEALENTVRHAATDRAAVALRAGANAVVVTVADTGRGFDPAAVSAAGHGFGLREDLVGRMAAIGGRAVVRSRPGGGTVVELEWRDD